MNEQQIARPRRALPPSLLPLGLALLLALPLAGCGGGGANSTPSQTPTPAPAAPPSVSAALSNGLTATFSEDRAAVSAGGTITYVQTLTNHTTQPIVILADAVAAGQAPPVPGGVEVVDSAGNNLYPGPVMPASVSASQNYTVAPGQALSTSTPVSARVFPSAGQYTATATFSAGTFPASRPTVLGPLTVTVQ